jgi:hypothetical protein
MPLFYEYLVCHQENILFSSSNYNISSPISIIDSSIISLDAKGAGSGGDDIL